MELREYKWLFGELNKSNFQKLLLKMQANRLKTFTVRSLYQAYLNDDENVLSINIFVMEAGIRMSEFEHLRDHINDLMLNHSQSPDDIVELINSYYTAYQSNFEILDPESSMYWLNCFKSDLLQNKHFYSLKVWINLNKFINDLIEIELGHFEILNKIETINKPTDIVKPPVNILPQILFINGEARQSCYDVLCHYVNDKQLLKHLIIDDEPIDKKINFNGHKTQIADYFLDLKKANSIIGSNDNISNWLVSNFTVKNEPLSHHTCNDILRERSTFKGNKLSKSK